MWFRAGVVAALPEPAKRFAGAVQVLIFRLGGPLNMTLLEARSLTLQVEAAERVQTGAGVRSACARAFAWILEMLLISAGTPWRS